MEAVSQIEEGQENVRRLLRHAVARIRVRLAPEVVRDAVSVMRADPAKLTPEEEVTLWTSIDALTQAVTPATAESLRLLEEIERDRRGGADVRNGADTDAADTKRARNRSPEEGPRQIRWARRTMIASLVAVILVQIYTLVLTNVATSVSTYQQKFEETKKQINQILQSNPDVEPSAEPRHTLDEAKKSLAVRIQGTEQILWRLTSPWAWLFGVPLPWNRDAVPSEDAADSSTLQEATQAFLPALTLYLLPLLYGVLGAAAYILRRLNQSIEDATLTVVLMYRCRLRLGLGALLGPTIGLFFSPETKVIPGTSLSLVAIAFLSGYSVEIVFALLDNLIERGRSALRPASDERPAVAQTQQTVERPRTASLEKPSGVEASNANGHAGGPKSSETALEPSATDTSVAAQDS